MDDKKQIRAWAMYDWADSAFVTTVMATVLPIFYASVAAKDLSPNIATAYWGYTQTISMLIMAVLAPILGAIADKANSKMRFLKSFIFIGVIGTGLLYFVGEGMYIMASVFFIIAGIGFSGANIFYDSFLPHIASPKKLDYVSSLGYSYGYLGGGILLAVNLVMIQKPEWFGFANSTVATQVCFITVAIWWLVFSIPIMRNMPKEKKIESKPISGNYIKEGFIQLATTFKHIRNYSELWKFLIAFWLFNDGIGTIIRMATIYGTEIGIGQSDLILALLLTQFVGVPCAILFGKLGEKIGAKKGIMIALFVYIIIIVLGYLMKTAAHFYIVAGLVGLVQGGAQALSRSLYGAMVPVNKSAEFFGFFGVSSKFAAITGPFLFGIVGQITGNSRWGILAIAFFFIVGILMLSRVNVEKGIKEGLEG